MSPCTVITPGRSVGHPLRVARSNDPTPLSGEIPNVSTNIQYLTLFDSTIRKDRYIEVTITSDLIIYNADD